MRSRAKIIATLGPASSTSRELRKMYVAGLDIVRLNFSHGSQKEHIARIKLIRALNQKMGRAIRIMQDLEGYRIRVGSLNQARQLSKRAIVYLAPKASGSGREIPFDYQGRLTAIKKGNLIYIDDGRILLKVIESAAHFLKASVIMGGLLKPHKGVNIIGARLEFPALTAKDAADLEVALKYSLEYVAQSFVRNARDVEFLRALITKGNGQCRIFSKIENAQALEALDEIIDSSDGIIVARGDLGICVPIYKVPIIQKEIIKKCLKRHKPVVVATQMLEGMVEESLPTRAEVTDVANAVFDGATHLMLSAETAVGAHPAKAVAMMNTIISYTEDYRRKQL